MTVPNLTIAILVFTKLKDCIRLSAGDVLLGDQQSVSALPQPDKCPPHKTNPWTR